MQSSSDRIQRGNEPCLPGGSKVRNARRSSVMVMALAGTVALTAAACSSSSKSNSSSSSSSSAASSAAASPTTQAADSAWQATVAAANQEGSVTWYTSNLPDESQGLVTAFNAVYPKINVTVARILTDLGPKLSAEKQTGAAGADVATTNDPTIAPSFQASNGLIPLTGPSAAAWSGNQYFTNDDEFVSNFNVLGLAYNTNLVKTPITGFNDLINAQLGGGKIGLPEPVATALDDWYLFVEKNTSSNFLTQLAAEKPTFYSSAVPLQQGVESGEIAVDAYAVPSISADIAKGAPVKFVVPKPAWAAQFYSFGVSWSKHPAAAKVFLDFMMSPAGQKALGVDGASALPGVTGTLTDLADVSPADTATLPAAQLMAEATRVNSAFGR
jgi:iron(III) transport system substrate-binding protein